MSNLAAIRDRVAGWLRPDAKPEATDWDWDGEGDEPHQKVCKDGSVITVGIVGEDGVIRRARPEDYPPGCWPPVRVGYATLPRKDSGSNCLENGKE